MSSLTIQDTDFKFCDICDNYVPEIIVDEESACKYCYDAYGEIH